MKSAIFAATLAATASAFAPSSSVRSSTSLSEFANGLVGGEGPEPMPFRGGEKTSKNFDPAGFSEVSLQCYMLGSRTYMYDMYYLYIL